MRRRLQPLDPRQRFLTALCHVRRGGPNLVTGNIILQFTNLPLLTGIEPQLLLPSKFFLPHSGQKAATIGGDLAEFKIADAIRHPLQKLLRMRYYHEGTFIVLQKHDQPFHLGCI